MRKYDIYSIGIPEGSSRAGTRQAEAVFEEIMAENFTELMKDLLGFRELSESQVQEIKKNSMLLLTDYKTALTKIKQAERKERLKMAARLLADFFVEIVQNREQ